MPDPTKPSPRGSQSRSLYIKIVTAFVGLLMISLVCVVLYDYTSNSRIVLRLSDALMARATDSAVEKCKTYLQPASVLAETSARIIRDGALPLDDRARLESFGLEVLRAHAQVSMFYLGDEQGNFLMLARQTNGTLSTQVIQTQPTRTVRWLHRDDAFRVVREEILPDDPYDPRTRPWYRGAKESQALFWTDVYVFYTGKVPGITCGAPVTDPAGNFHGVIGVDLDLGELSRFLQTLNLGPSGVALILNESGSVVAFPDVDRVVVTEGDDARTVRVEELDVPQLRAAAHEYSQTRSPQGTVTVAGRRYLYSLRDFPVTPSQNWKLVIAVAEDDFVGEVKRANRISFAIGVAVLLLSVGIAAVLSRSISRPVVQLTDEANRIRDFNLEGEVTIHSQIREIELLSLAVAAMKSSLQAFRKYVPAELVRQLIQSGEEARVGGQRRELTLLFSDIEGFTTLSEGMTPETLMVHLSEYLDEVTRIIMEDHGTVDKYIGDAVMAFWGAPLPDAQHARNACAAALRCQERITVLNEEWRRAGKTPLPTRIGIHTGETVVGNMGSGDRLNYTAIGDAVNLANRLEGVNKIFGTRILVSGATREQVANEFLLRPIAIVAVKGKTTGVPVYELIGSRTGTDPVTERFCAEFTRGVELYQRRAWKEALAVFEALAAGYPQDKPSALYRERCSEFAKQPPGQDWSPVEQLDTK